MIQILKNSNFSKLFWAGLSSQLGSFITETAIMLLVFELSGKNKAVLGISKATFLVFLTLGSLLGGPIGSRYNRKNVLLFCEFIRIPLVIGLFYYQNIYYIIIADGLIAFFTGIFNPSRQTLINELTTKDEIQAANSLFSTSLAFIHMAGPFIGAWVFTAFGGISEIVSFDLLTYIIGIILIFKLTYKHVPANNENKTNFIQDLKEGFSYTKSRKDLSVILIFVLITGFCIGVLIPLLLPFTLEFLKSDKQSYGVLMAFFGVGGLVGAPVYQILSKYFSSAKIIVVGFFAEPILMLIWSRVPTTSVSMFILFIWGISVFVRFPAQLTYFSQTVEIKFMSRVHSLLDMAFIVPNIFGSLFVSLIGNSFTAQETLALISVVFFLLIYPSIFFPGMRSLWKSSVKMDESTNTI